jgi:molybdopterin-containing oxidoreductase family membrane subunit
MWNAAFDSAALFVSTDLFTGYGLYTFVLVIWTLFRTPGKMLASWDESANLLVRYAGVFLLIYLISIFTLIDPGENEEFNPYPWALVTIWIAASQFLWIKVFRINRWLRLVVAFVLFFSFDQYVVFVTSLHRDYVPSNWISRSTSGYLIAIALALITKAVTFVVFAYVLTYIRSLWANRKINQ